MEVLSSESELMVNDLQSYFKPFREKIIGIDQEFDTPYGRKRIIYTDWTASGRLYAPIEERLIRDFGPFVANTHTLTTTTGTAMTQAYKKAKEIIKDHVNANEDDILILTGTGMTGAVNKLQRILGLKIPENIKPFLTIPEEMRPVVFLTHMEHHSNQTSWLETIATVEVVSCDDEGLFKLEHLGELLEKYDKRPLKIASVTACSNVTGIMTPYHDIAKLMHQHGGVCFVDFACSAPYVAIDMHPSDRDANLDAIFFSPHKFLGGPGTNGVLLFSKHLYHNMIPDCPGGGTVSWTNPWGEHKYLEDIEEREDGGTPGFLQTIRTALAMNLKEQMGVENILRREHQIVGKLLDSFEKISGVHVLASQHRNRLGVISFYVDDLHYNLGVKLLNDRFGIQTRGGCSCAGTYGHYLLHVDKETSRSLIHQISIGDLLKKPGWIRLSVHPTLTDEEIDYVIASIKVLAKYHKDWSKDYIYDKTTNEFVNRNYKETVNSKVENWFQL